jgi:hypothetical protein
MPSLWSTDRNHRAEATIPAKVSVVVVMAQTST